MRTYLQRRQRYIGYLRRRTIRAVVYCIINLGAVILGFLILVPFLPSIIGIIINLSAVRKSDGTHLLLISDRLKIVMATSLFIEAIFAGVLGGLMRSLFRGGMFDRLWLMLLCFAAFATVFLYSGSVVTEVTEALASVGADKPLVAMFLSGWLLLLGYTIKVPWDEFRDRCAGFFDRVWEPRKFWGKTRKKASRQFP